MRAKLPVKPISIKSSYVKPRVRFQTAIDENGVYIPKAQGQRFIKNYNYNLAQMYKKVPEVRPELERQLRAQGFELTKSGLIRYTEGQNIKLTELGYGKDKLNLLSNEGLKRVREQAEKSGDKTPFGKMLKSRLYVEHELKKLDFFYKKNSESSDRYGVRDFDFTKSREELEKIAPELFKGGRKEGGKRGKGQQLTYSELEDVIERLKNKGII